MSVEPASLQGHVATIEFNAWPASRHGSAIAYRRPMTDALNGVTDQADARNPSVAAPTLLLSPGTLPARIDILIADNIILLKIGSGLHLDKR